MHAEYTSVVSLSQLEQQAAQPEKSEQVTAEPPPLQEMRGKVQQTLFTEESRDHREIRKEMHANKISLKDLAHEVDRHMFPDRLSENGARWKVHQIERMRYDIRHLQTLASSIRTYNLNKNDVSARSTMRREAIDLLGGIAVKIHTSWIDEEEAENTTSKSAAFVRLVYEQLIAADIITEEEKIDAFDSALDWKAEDPPTEATLRKWDVKLFPERIRTILFEKLDYDKYLRKLQEEIQTLELKSLLWCLEREGITTEEEQRSWRDKHPDERDEYGRPAHYSSFIDFINIRRSLFCKVVGKVRTREVSNYPAAWEKWWAKKEEFNNELEMGRIFHSV